VSLLGSLGFGLDRLIGVAWPATAARRMAARSQLEGISLERNYDAARPDRYGSGWTAVNKRPEETDAGYRERIRARARDLERNNSIASAVLLAMERHVVGTGLRPQAKVAVEGGDEDDALNTQIEELWSVWSRAENCDITGGDSFYGLQRMLIRRMVCDGEIFALTSSAGEFLPLSVQLVEPDSLAGWLPGVKDRTIVAGVEVNDYYRPLAYWFYTSNMTPGLNAVGNATRVEASRVLPLFIKTRPQAVRGMSMFAQSMGAIRDSGEYMDAELMAARIAACFAAFVSEGASGAQPRVGRNFTVSDEDGVKKATRLEPGMINYLGDARVDFASPTHPNTAAGDFVSLQQRLVGAGMGQSYESVSRDVSKTNYSSCRSAVLEDEAGYKVLRQLLVDKVLDPLWAKFVTASVLSGKLKIRDYFSAPEKYNRVRWVPPARQWVDPLKEVEATEKELANNITTMAEVCASKGLDWRETVQQRAREKAFMKELLGEFEQAAGTGTGTAAGSEDDGEGDGGDEDLGNE